MRPTAIFYSVVLAVLSGCTTATPVDVWHAQQRIRLDRMDRHGSLENVLAEVIAQVPNVRGASIPSYTPTTSILSVVVSDPVQPTPPASIPPVVVSDPVQPTPPASIPPVVVSDPVQDSAHSAKGLSERLVDGSRPFRHAWQPLEVTVTYANGDVMLRADGTSLNDRTDANFVGVRMDTASGVALHGEWWSSDSTLFGGKFINNGIDPKAANAELGGFDLFPHACFDRQVDDWSLPVRVGLFTELQRLDHQEARVEREWVSFGPRIMFEPTWTLFAEGDRSLHLFGLVGGDVAATWFSDEYVNGNDRDVMPRLAYEVGAGLRASYGVWHAEVGYRLNHAMYGESEGDLFGNPFRTELKRQRVYFGLGMTF